MNRSYWKREGKGGSADLKVEFEFDDIFEGSKYRKLADSYFFEGCSSSKEQREGTTILA